MEIKIEDYLSDEEVKDIIASEVREQTRYAFNSKRLDPNTLLSNAGYYAVFAAVDEHLGETGYAQKQVERETRRIINEMTEYTLFGDRGSYPNYRTSAAQKIVDEHVENNRDLIEAQVVDRLSDISERIGGDRIHDFIIEVVRAGLEGAEES